MMASRRCPSRTEPSCHVPPSSGPRRRNRSTHLANSSASGSLPLLLKTPTIPHILILLEGDSEDFVQAPLIRMILVGPQLAAACDRSRFVLVLQKVADFLDQLGYRLECLNLDSRHEMLCEHRPRGAQLESAAARQLECA